ncbi:MAG: iron ABC transporter permease [Treponema sp.]|nr:iron ABC transporter permease [Treponema sp.]
MKTSRMGIAAGITVTAVLIVLLIFALFSGSVRIPPETMVRILSGRERDTPLAHIVWELRLPRIFMALLVGMLLAAGGTISQTVFRNPLADPYIIGINAGAVAGAVLAFMLKLPDLHYGLFAFLGAAGTSFLVFRLSAGEGRTDTSLLLVTGVAVSAFLSALSSFCMYMAGQDSYRVMIWTMGYLGAASWSRIIFLSVPLTLGLLYFLYHRQELDALLLGDDEAHSLGLPVASLKRRLLLAVSLMAAFSVAFAGMIGFVGLIVPHAVRRLTGNSHGRLLPLAAYTGGVFLLFADILSRTLLAPVEIPIGVITAFFGAPFFLFLAIRRTKVPMGKGGRFVS